MDGLFYKAQKLEVQGHSRENSLTKVWSGPLAAPLQETEAHLPPKERRFEDPGWVSYSAQFYRRRWLLPAMAAGVDPLLEEHSLETLSLLGYVLLAPLLYLLLRKRFAPAVSLLVAAGCLVVPPLHGIASAPLTDSWGLALMVAALLAAMKVLERGPRWLPIWMLVIAALSVTRDLTIVLMLASVWLMLRHRTRRAAELAVSGAAAALPALVLLGAPAREHLAYVLHDSRIPSDTSWRFLFDNYWDALRDLVAHNAVELLVQPRLPLGLLAVAALIGVAFLLRRPPRGDPFFTLHRAALFAGLPVLVTTVSPSNLRLELVFIPPLAVGLALAATALLDRWQAAVRVGPGSAQKRLVAVSVGMSEGGRAEEKVPSRPLPPGGS